MSSSTFAPRAPQSSPLLDCLVLGAGITGLTAAFHLRRAGKTLCLLDTAQRVGGQIATHRDGEFCFESGPNTAVISQPEVVELFDALAKSLPHPPRLVEAQRTARQRWIWKNKRFHPLPTGLWSGLRTPLFTFTDKLRLLAEPFRSRGTDANESVADLAARRLGRSFRDYAVDPFVGGIYAGNAAELPTRWALPRLHRLEADHGSFVRGAIAKQLRPKSPRERLATKAVFSVEGGLQSLTDALAIAIGTQHIALGLRDLCLQPLAEGGWQLRATNAEGAVSTWRARRVVCAVPAYALPSVLPFVGSAKLAQLSALRYAPVVQVAVGFSDVRGASFPAFGGLVPSCEGEMLLGVLFPSSCFAGRAPEGGALFSVFMGGMRQPQLVDCSDEELRQIALEGLQRMLPSLQHCSPSLLRIFRHRRAIPQYELSTEQRLAAVAAIESEHRGLHLIGNLRDGIGLSDRIAQAAQVAQRIVAEG